jgi:hypothetical protein
MLGLRAQIAFAVVVASLLASRTACAENASQPAKPPLEMYRTAAGTDDGTGWFAAQSTPSGFKVMMPARFNDFTIRADDPNIGELVTDSLGTELPDGIKVMVARMIGTEKSRVADLDGLIANLKSAPMGQDIKTADKGTLDGLPLLSVYVQGTERLAHIRYLVDGKDLYFISVECLASVKDRCDAIKEKVYATFARR